MFVAKESLSAAMCEIDSWVSSAIGDGIFLWRVALSMEALFERAAQNIGCWAGVRIVSALFCIFVGMAIGWKPRVWSKYIPFAYRETRVEFIEDDGSHMCGAASRVAAGVMAVSVAYFEAARDGQRYWVTQARHERCANAMCPVQVFQSNPDGSRRLIANTVMPLIEISEGGDLIMSLQMSVNGQELRFNDVSLSLQ